MALHRKKRANGSLRSLAALMSTLVMVVALVGVPSSALASEDEVVEETSSSAEAPAPAPAPAPEPKPEPEVEVQAPAPEPQPVVEEQPKVDNPSPPEETVVEEETPTVTSESLETDEAAPAAELVDETVVPSGTLAVESCSSALFESDNTDGEDTPYDLAQNNVSVRQGTIPAGEQYATQIEDLDLRSGDELTVQDGDGNVLASATVSESLGCESPDPGEEEPVPTFEDIGVSVEGCEITFTNPVGNPRIYVQYSAGDRDTAATPFVFEGGSSETRTFMYDELFASASLEGAESDVEYIQYIDGVFVGCAEETPPVSEDEKLVLTSEECHKVTFTNPNEVSLGVEYGDFDEPSSDDFINVGAGESTTITTLRELLDGDVYLDGDFFLYFFEDFIVEQNCDDGGSTPPPNGEDDETDDDSDDDVATPGTDGDDDDVTPVTDVTPTTTLPDTGGLEAVLLWTALGLLGGGVMVLRNRRKFVAA